ncbi:MAG: hypothetical protein PHP69_00700 [Candidatus Omnitrophica bacterium]|nr:hypothetical protein [Candidatus Omnitrophota bacterium]
MKTRILNRRMKKGVLLVFLLAIITFFLGISSVFFIRNFSEFNLAKRQQNGMGAFYAAEAGISYAYWEAARAGFCWYTHLDNQTPVSGLRSGWINSDSGGSSVFIYGDVPIKYDDAKIDEDGYYVVKDKNFKVKAYPEKRDGEYTGVIVVVSQGEVDGIKRTLEYRLGQQSAYQYFFFFPGNYTFGSATYNGRNYGGMHVNGNVRFNGTLSLKYLTEFTASGFLYYYNGVRPNMTSSSSTNYNTSLASVAGLSSYFYGSNYYLFSDCYTYFYTGNMKDSSTQKRVTLIYLDDDLYPGSEWSFDAYSGSSDGTSFKYDIGEEDLKNLAIRELTKASGEGYSGYTALFDSSNNIEITVDGEYVTYNEATAFEKLYAAERSGTDVDWDSFWSNWKSNHSDDYSSYASQGLISDDGLDWERRFFQAAYNWSDLIYSSSGSSIVYRNLDWISDMYYGDNRLDRDGDYELAYAENEANANQYFLNTQYQAEGFENFLVTNNLDEEGKYQTYVAEASTGGKYVDTGDILSSYTDTNSLKEKAKDGGIYIGCDGDDEYDAWKEELEETSSSLEDCQGYIEDIKEYLEVYGGTGSWIETWLTSYLSTYEKKVESLAIELEDLKENEPIMSVYDLSKYKDFITEKEFYNMTNPNTDSSGNYIPSKVYSIDVNKIIEAQDDGNLSGFNGIIYVDLSSKYLWEDDTNYSGGNAECVMLENAERLPDGGLSIVTPNNVIIKGNYNLDAEGDKEKNREEDPATVLNNAIKSKAYLTSYSDYEWQPSEIITNRYVYTVSTDYPEPSYMPLCNSYAQEYVEENSSQYVDYDFVNNQYYPTDDWVPTASSIVVGNPKLSDWFNYYYDGVVPDQFSTDWVNANWNSTTVYSMDTDGDGEPDKYILGSDLTSAVQNAIGTAYSSAFAYDTIHGVGGDDDDTPSRTNIVRDNHVYNTAIVSPYDVNCYSLEYWSGATSIINGAFIQLPLDNKEKIPSGAKYSRYNNPSRQLNYESRYGKNANPEDRPNANLTFGCESSWREVSNDVF